MGGAWSCSRRHQPSQKEQQHLLQQQQQHLYEQMRLRQVAEAREQDEMMQLGHRGWSDMTEEEMTVLLAMQDRHLAEERELIGHLRITIRRVTLRLGLEP